MGSRRNRVSECSEEKKEQLAVQSELENDRYCYRFNGMASSFEGEDFAAVIADKDDTIEGDDIVNEDDDDESSGDEENGFSNAENDPYVYSDDSASLSDAYFFPTDDELARPLRYRDSDIFPHHPSHPHHNYPFLSSPVPHYGSINNNNNGIYHESSDVAVHTQSAFHQYTPYHTTAQPPLWVAGSIAEDGTVDDCNLTVPVEVGGDAVILDASSRARKERRRQRRMNRDLRLKQQQQAARERAVSQVRGQLQIVDTWQDPFFAILFCIQLVVVVLCAIVYGREVIYRVTTDFESKNSAAFESGRMIAELVYDATTGQVQYNDQRFYDRDDPDDPIFDVRTPYSTHFDLLTSTATVSNDESRSGTNFFDFTLTYQRCISLVAVTGCYACTITYIGFGCMILFAARALIQVMLVVSVIMALLWGSVGLTLDPYGIISILGFAALLMTLGYTLYNWSRIPFAATNLYTALSAMRWTADFTILGILTLVLAFGWILVWIIAFIGIVNALNTFECQQKDACHLRLSYHHTLIYFFMLLSFLWTNLVIRNLVRVTVASAIGTWWFRPNEIRPFCTAALRRPLLRSLSTSLGSICLASLVIDPAQCLLGMFKCCCGICDNNSSNCCTSNSNCMTNGDDSSFDAVTDDDDHNNNKQNLFNVVAQAVAARRSSIGDYEEALTRSLSRTAVSTSAAIVPKTSTITKRDESKAEAAIDPMKHLYKRLCQLFLKIRFHLRSCNRWSFTYIGMYGYNFHEAGERALQLFETREWLDVVGDNLIQNVLLMVSMVIGGSTGTFAVVVEESDGYFFSSNHMPTMSAFLIGSVLGFVLSNILLLGIVGSAVNTVLVCFAAGPFEFDKNHPKLSREMREVWSQQVWEPAE